jgi:hypothetical protein
MIVSRSEGVQEVITIRARSFSIFVTSDSATCLGPTPVGGPTATIPLENSRKPEKATAGCRFMVFDYT